MTSFERLAPAMGAFFLAPVIMALIFYTSILRGGSPIKPQTYGEFVYQIDAWVWCAVQVAICGAASVSAFLCRAKAHTIAAVLAGLLMEFFAAAAALGNAEEVVLVAMAIPCGGLCFLSAGVSWGHGRG